MHATFFLIFIKTFNALNPLSSTKCLQDKKIKPGKKCNWTWEILSDKEKQIYSFLGELVGGKMYLKWVFTFP